MSKQVKALRLEGEEIKMKNHCTLRLYNEKNVLSIFSLDFNRSSLQRKLGSNFAEIAYFIAKRRFQQLPNLTIRSLLKI